MTMQAASYKDGEINIISCPIPKIKPDEVLIKVAAAGLNRADCLQRRGLYPPPPGVTSILGLEVAGTICEVGSAVQDVHVGNRVCAVVQGGAMAQFCAVQADTIITLPHALPFEQAAAFPETFATVYDCVLYRGALQANETLLVHGGTSGIGMAAITLARELGANVVTTAGSDEKVEACLEAGANLAINYRTQHFKSEILKHYPDGVNVILDYIGAQYFNDNIDLLAMDGRMVLIGLLSGQRVETKLAPFISKRIALIGAALRSRPLSDRIRITNFLQDHVVGNLADGSFTLKIDTVAPLEELAAMHAYMESSAHIGKIVIQLPS